MRETFPAYMPQLFKHEGGYVDIFIIALVKATA